MLTTDNHIYVRLANHKDQLRWDTYVLNHPDASPYHFFAWKLAVEESYSHDCLYIYAETDGRLVGILPIVHIRLPGLVNELTALPYCDVGSCLCDNDLVQDALLTEALSMQKLVKSNKLHLRGPLKETELKKTSFHTEVTGKVRMLLDLPASSGELFAGFKSKLRSQIRKAEKNGITFCWGGLDDLDDIYSVFSKNMHELGSPVHAKSWLKNVLTHYSQRAKVGLVRFETKMVGMGIILLSGHGVSIPWASTLRDCNQLGPNMLLYWNFLQFSADNGFKVFDFGRSTEEEGTYRFKEQWGAKPKLLTWYVKSEAHDGDIQKSQHSDKREVVSNIWRTIPLSVANTIGPYIRKYISL